MEWTQLPDGRYLLDITLGQSAYEKLLYAQALLGGEVALEDVLRMALKFYVAQELRKVARRRPSGLRPRRRRPGGRRPSGRRRN